MNDYRRIHRRSSTRRLLRIRHEDTLAWHRRSWSFIEDAFVEGGGDRTIVVTHHAPSLRSLTDPFNGTDHCYASDLEAEIGRWRPALWVHNHIHRRADYVVYATRIVCNPLGRAEEDKEFAPTVT